MGNIQRRRWLDSIVVLIGLTMSSLGLATEVALVGLYANKALVVVDGGKPHSIPVGVRGADGVKLISIEEGSATFEIDGKRQHLAVGQHAVSAGRDETSGTSTTLMADGAGHFLTVGTINGAPTRFLVDTGATLVSIGKTDAARANVDYEKGQPSISMTANGPTRIWRVTLNSVRVGDVLLNQVEAAVHEHDLPVALLGMSFLNRMEMKREGQALVLKKRY